MGRRKELYRFRYYDVMRKRWIEARYRTEKDVIASRYEGFEGMGEPEIREEGDLYDGTFRPT
jgi:hypothetical protein